MATFSTNQVRQLYVVKSLIANHGNISATDAVGAIAIPYSAKPAKARFEYKGVAEGTVRTDMIDTAKVVKVSKTTAASMAKKLKKVDISLNSDVNSGAPIAGQDYILRLAFRQFVGLSDEDQYFKYGEVLATTGMTAPKFYEEMVKSLRANIKADVSPLVSANIKDLVIGGLTLGLEGAVSGVKIAVAAVGTEAASYSNGTLTITPANGSTAASLQTKIDAQLTSANFSVKVKAVGTLATASATDAATGVTVEGVAPYWRLGVFAQALPQFDVQAVAIVASGISTINWATISNGEGATITNGKDICDLEYFCMGERGDIYRNVGFPHNIVTKYLADESKTYDVYDIEYYYEGSAEDVQKSPKCITLAVDTSVGGLSAGIESALETTFGVSL